MDGRRDCAECQTENVVRIEAGLWKPAVVGDKIESNCAKSRKGQSIYKNCRRLLRLLCLMKIG